MIRKLIDLVVFVIALLFLTVCVVSRFTSVHWRVTPWASADSRVSMIVASEHELVETNEPYYRDTVGLNLALYYGDNPPEESSSEVLDRVFYLKSEVTAGEVSVLRPGEETQVYAGVRRMKIQMTWWAAALCSGMVVLLLIVGRLRRRKARPSAEDDSAPSSAPAAAGGTS